MGKVIKSILHLVFYPWRLYKVYVFNRGFDKYGTVKGKVISTPKEYEDWKYLNE